MTAPPLSPCDHGATYGDNERRTCVECGLSFPARPEDVWPAPPLSQWLVAYAPCGCVRAVRVVGYGRSEEDDFRREYPGSVAVADWPQIKCGTHLAAIGGTS